MEIQHSDNNNEGLFYVEKDGKQVATMGYQHSGDHEININHTEVDASLKGQGVGHQLIEAAVNYLRKNNMKAVATCPFVKSVFEKNHEEFKDIIQS